MRKIQKIKKNGSSTRLVGGVVIALVLGLLVGSWFGYSQNSHDHAEHMADMMSGDMEGMQHDHSVEDIPMMREGFISMKKEIQRTLMPEGMYRCCLENPCTYCIEKTPGHGEGAACDCLSDIMNGVHPCGECVGEILEGHGNPLLAEYFARAIAEKTGQIEAIRLIIEEKYGIPVEEQL